MNSKKILRCILAENGVEKTPAEFAVMYDRMKRLWNSVGFGEYMMYKGLDDDDMRAMASEIEYPYEKVKNLVEIMTFVGQLKFGETQ